jgi:hypothetical protein
MKPSRLAKLERWVRERPCPKCGREFSLPSAVRMLPEFERLAAAEQGELVRLLEAASTSPCSRCGRTGRDGTRLTDDQKRRAGVLLGILLGPTRRGGR